MAELIALSDFSPPARSLSRAPRGVAAGDSAIYQRHHLVASRCETCNPPQRILLHQLACHTEVSAFLDISRAKLNLSYSIYLRNKLLGLPCLTLLCFARDGRSIRYHPLLRPAIAVSLVRCIGKQFHRSLEDLVFQGLSVVCEICR